MGLESEYQVHTKGKKRLLIANLRANGATEAEIEFMFRDFDTTRSTRRVELNAMTSPQFIGFLEQKLKEHGVAKVVPDEDELAESYRFFARNRKIEKIVQRELKSHKSDEEAIAVPDNCVEQVRKVLSERPELRWDSAVYELAGGKLIKTQLKSKSKKSKLKSDRPKGPDMERIETQLKKNIRHAVTSVLGEGWYDPTKQEADE